MNCGDEDTTVLRIPIKARPFPCFYIENGTVRLDTGIVPSVFFGMFEKMNGSE